MPLPTPKNEPQRPHPRRREIPPRQTPRRRPATPQLLRPPRTTARGTSPPTRRRRRLPLRLAGRATRRRPNPRRVAANAHPVRPATRADIDSSHPDFRHALPTHRRSSRTTPSAQQPAPQISVTFSPNGQSTAAIAAEIAKAKTSVHVMIYELTSPGLATELIAAKTRGCEVIVVADKLTAASPPAKSPPSPPPASTCSSTPP